MLPIFANPVGLWVLLGVPAIFAIHVLQQRARAVRTSTWFLIEKLAPDSARGRTWDRLRSSRTLWLQVAAVILAAWVLGEPRWLRTESAQTVVIVLDASASMDAFRTPALAAAERELGVADGLAAQTTWVIMTTNPRQPPLFRGTARAAAHQALARWEPELGQHDFGPALRLARSLAGVGGRTLLITDTRTKVPADQRAAGVGQLIENVGFAGATLAREGGSHVWRALVKNHGTTAQRRTWALEAGGALSAAQSIELPAGGLTEISAQLPAGVDRATVVLAEDGFALDNRLPLIVPRPKPLTVAVEGTDAAAEFFRQVARAVDGVTVPPVGAPGTLRVARLAAVGVATEPRGGIFWPPADERAQAPLLTDPVTAERDPLVAGLNWQGWFGAGPHGFSAAPGDATLLWHGRWPLVFVRSPAAATSSPSAGPRQLMLAFDWATSNASRLPATVLLARRFFEAERDRQSAAYAANFDAGARVAITGVPLDGQLTLTIEGGTASGPAPAGAGVAGTSAAAAGAGGAGPGTPRLTTVIPPAERTELRAPARSGFFTVRRDDVVLVQGAAQFADARQGDFRAAESFFNEMRSERAAALERNTTADPFVNLWLALLGAVVLWSWWLPRRGAAASTGAGSPARGTPALP